MLSRGRSHSPEGKLRPPIREAAHDNVSRFETMKSAVKALLGHRRLPTWAWWDRHGRLGMF